MDWKQVRGLVHEDSLEREKQFVMMKMISGYGKLNWIGYYIGYYITHILLSVSLLSSSFFSNALNVN